jgi:hypothetical protein
VWAVFVPIFFRGFLGFYACVFGAVRDMRESSRLCDHHFGVAVLRNSRVNGMKAIDEIATAALETAPQL